MAPIRSRELFSGILSAIHHQEEKLGSTTRQIIGFMKMQPNQKWATKNLKFNVNRALRQGVEAGILKKRCGRFKIDVKNVLGNVRLDAAPRYLKAVPKKHRRSPPALADRCSLMKEKPKRNNQRQKPHATKSPKQPQSSTDKKYDSFVREPKPPKSPRSPSQSRPQRKLRPGATTAPTSHRQHNRKTLPRDGSAFCQSDNVCMSDFMRLASEDQIADDYSGSEGRNAKDDFSEDLEEFADDKLEDECDEDAEAIENERGGDESEDNEDGEGEEGVKKDEDDEDKDENGGEDDEDNENDDQKAAQKKESIHDEN